MVIGEMAYRENKKAHAIELIFSSAMKNIDAVCEKTTSYLQKKIENIEPELFSINLVIREGLTNAIRHGNRSDTGKDVRLFVALKKGACLYMEIEDQGEGFDWRRHTDKLPSNEKDHGRGIPIIAAYFDRYFYNDKGNILYLEKTLFS